MPDLSHWLQHIERIHPKTVEMGLGRVNAVKAAMGLDPGFRILTVAGTNGKGSTCAMLESLLHHCGYRVGCYTSPHLLRFSERIRLGREEAADEAICRAFSRVEAARAGVSLTYFEFTTLAAVALFVEAGVDIAVLEVGLGGRLDAVNAFDPHCAVITGIDFDHMDYLGDTLEAIAMEKSGIFRRDRCAVSADARVAAHAQDTGARLKLAGRDFSWRASGETWDYLGMDSRLEALSRPRLEGRKQFDNAALALAALECLGVRMDAGTASRALSDLELPGRFQKLGKAILDVAHNPQAAQTLAENLAQTPCAGKTIAVFAMLADKDIEGVISKLSGAIDAWRVYGLDVPRGADAARLMTAFSRLGVENVSVFSSMREAWDGACALASGNDTIVIFGSFHTVADFMDLHRGARGHG